LISTNSKFDLVINFSELLGYSNILTIPRWQTDDKCHLVTDNETHGFDYNTEMAFSFSHIALDQGATKWINDMPSRCRQLLLEHDELFEKNWLSLYFSIGLNSHVCDLLESNPILLALLTQKACSGLWSIEKFIQVATAKQTDILKSCGLPPNKSVAKTLSRISVKSLRHQTLSTINSFLDCTACHKINHLKNFNVELMKLLTQYPELAASCLILNNTVDVSNREFKFMFNDTLRLLNLFNYPNPLIRIGGCKSVNQLQVLHDRLTLKLNKIERDGEINVNFCEPPFVGNEDIIPITHSKELYSEGRIQSHCLGSYLNQIVSNKYYAYKVLRPERATLGLKLVGKEVWQFDQLRLVHNGKPSKETMESVNHWLNS
jgi:hypothetical protein